MLPSAHLKSLSSRFFFSLHPTVSNRPRGPMDEASAYGAGDCSFESYQGHCLDTLLMTSRKEAIMSVIKLLCCSERETLSAVMLVKKTTVLMMMDILSVSLSHWRLSACSVDVTWRLDPFPGGLRNSSGTVVLIRKPCSWCMWRNSACKRMACQKGIERDRTRTKGRVDFVGIH